MNLCIQHVLRTHQLVDRKVIKYKEGTAFPNSPASACTLCSQARKNSLRHIIGLAKVVEELHQRVRLNKGFKLDLLWCVCFLPSCNSISMMVGKPLPLTYLKQQPYMYFTKSNKSTSLSNIINKLPSSQPQCHTGRQSTIIMQPKQSTWRWHMLMLQKV